MLPPSLSPRAGGASYDPAEAIGNRPAIRQTRAMLSDAQRRFLAYCRVGHLATAARKGMPHVTPLCHVLAEGTVYITIDEKPKRQDRPLKRVRNILDNPQAAFVADRYDEDWRRLGWVMLRGRAEILDVGPEHDRAQAIIVARYPQLKAMHIAELPVIALRIAR